MTSDSDFSNSKNVFEVMVEDGTGIDFPIRKYLGFPRICRRHESRRLRGQVWLDKRWPRCWQVRRIPLNAGMVGRY